MSSIVVVGGGLAGLACAWRLRGAGHDVELLEASANAGGTVQTELVDGYRLEHGQAAFGPLEPNHRFLVSSLGLDDALVPIEPPGEAVLRRGACVPLDTSRLRSLAASPLLSASAKFRSTRLLAELARQRGEFDLHHPERMAAHERTDAATDLARIVGVEARDFLFGPVIESSLGVGLEECSDAFARLALYRVLFSGSGTASATALSGGMGRVVDAIAGQVPVRTQTRVTHIETEQSGAVVHYRTTSARSGEEREGRVFADAVVVALSPAETSEVCPKLTPDERGFLSSIESQRAVVVHLLLDDRLRSHPFYTLHIPSQLGLDIARVRIESHKRDAAPPGSGLLRVDLAPRSIDRLWRMDDAKLGRRVVEAVERTPLGRLRPQRVVVHRDERAVSRFGPGSLARLHAFTERCDRTPRLAFAGDHCVGPYTEGAVTSGMRAATEIARDVVTR